MSARWWPRPKRSLVGDRARVVVGPDYRAWLPRTQRAPRVGPPELLEVPFGNGPADVRHQALVEPDIMHGDEDRSKHLGGEKKVADGAAGEGAAGVAVAAGLDRPRVAQVLAVA